MSPPWQIDRLAGPQVGHFGWLRIVDAADGPAGRVVCVIPGHLQWQATPETVMRLLDEDDAANARLIAAAPQLRCVVAALLEWAVQMGGWSAPCWQDAQDLLAKLRDPHAGT